jgi:hypothetical protein
MKRSERLKAKAIDSGLWAAASFFASLAVGVWSISAMMSLPVLGALMSILAMVGLIAAVSFARGAFSYAYRAQDERAYERTRSIRPNHLHPVE